ncbi:hypothetical protein ACGFYF_40880 [Streptomyces lavendulae]|uniref:hypothetical protein n=1 Tax=Streptomyces lavendulae TaxID=1914 RepID=UPI00371F7608
MSYEAHDLNLNDPTQGYLNFVLYTEVRFGVASSALNAEVFFEANQTQTHHFQEWLSRLVPCEPNAMHCTLVPTVDIPTLFRPSVIEDRNSPTAPESRCTCRRAFYDPEFGLPVVGEHFRHVDTSGTDKWSYQTYAPLELRPDDTFSRFHTDRRLFWARTEKGNLSILPQRHPLTYNIGYNGGGPRALAAYLTQLATTNGQNTTAGAPFEIAHPAIVAWTQSKATERGTNELSLSDLQAMMTR